MILIHPNACSPAKIAAIQLATGLKAIAGKRHARLVLQNGSNPILGTSLRPAPRPSNRDPHDGGHAA